MGEAPVRLKQVMKLQQFNMVGMGLPSVETVRDFTPDSKAAELDPKWVGWQMSLGEWMPEVQGPPAPKTP